MTCSSRFGRLVFKVLIVSGIVLAWTPTVALGCFWLRWFRFFISMQDYGENDFGTIFYVVIGLVVTGGTVMCGILSAAISIGILRGLRSKKSSQVEPPSS